MKKFYNKPNTECQPICNVNNICITSIRGGLGFGGKGDSIDPM